MQFPWNPWSWGDWYASRRSTASAYDLVNQGDDGISEPPLKASLLGSLTGQTARPGASTGTCQAR